MTATETPPSARRGTLPTSSTPLILLCLLTGTLAAVAAGVGFFSTGGVGPFTATNVHGEAVEMYGRGVYEYDSLFRGSGQRGTDLVVLGVMLPLLAVSAWFYRRGSFRALLILVGALVALTYVGISYLGAVAYNELFLLYVVLFSSSLFTLVRAVRALDLVELGRRIGDRMPRRGPAAFLFVGGVVTTGVWLMTPLEGLLSGEPPGDLETYTTLFTNGLDMAVIVPSLFLAGGLVLRRDPLGYALAVPLTVFAGLLAPMITAMTVLQVQAGVEFTAAMVVGPISGFVVLAGVAVWVVVTLLRHLDTG